MLAMDPTGVAVSMFYSICSMSDQVVGDAMQRVKISGDGAE